MAQIQETFEWTDPEELLQEDCYLVLEYTPAELATASSDTRRVWEESLNVARSAAHHSETRRHIGLIDSSGFDDLQSSFFGQQQRTGWKPGCIRIVDSLIL